MWSKMKSHEFLLKFAWLGYLIIFIVLAFPQGLDTVIASSDDKLLFVTGSNKEIQEVFGPADIASYARGGENLVKDISEFLDGSYVNLWAPGMFVLHGILSLLGENAPVVLIIFMLGFLAWSVVFNKLCTILHDVIGCSIWLAFLIPISCFLISPFRNITLTSGALGAETFAITPFILGLLYLVESIFMANSRKLLIFAGLCFSFSAYMKASFDIYMRMFACLVLLFFTFYHLIEFLKKIEFKKSAITWNKEYKVVMKNSLIVLSVFFITTLPWRIIHEPGWVNGQYIYAYIWMPDHQLADFVVAGGVNASACKIKPLLCQSFQQGDITENRNNEQWMSNLIYQTKLTLLTNPFEWVYYKLPYLYKYWFKEGRKSESIYTFFINVMLLAMTLGIFVIAIIRRTVLDMTCSLFLFAVVIGTLIPHFIIHFEARYLYPLKIITLCIFPVIFINFLQSKK